VIRSNSAFRLMGLSSLNPLTLAVDPSERVDCADRGSGLPRLVWAVRHIGASGRKLHLVREHELKNPWPVQRCLTFQEAMGFLEIGQSGTFRRNPDKYNDPKDFSRDQTIPIVAAMGLCGDTPRFERFWVRTVARNYTTQNGESLRPDGVNLFQRARGAKPGL